MQNLTIANGVRAVRNDEYLQRDYSVHDFSEYTCFPTLRLEWCIYLFLGIDPRDFNRNCPGELDAFAKILELAESSRSEGTFPCRTGEITDLVAVRLSHADFIQWAEVHTGTKAPEEWVSHLPQTNGERRLSLHLDRREIIVDAAIHMFKRCNIRPQSQKRVIKFIREHPDQYSASCIKEATDGALLQSLKITGGTPLKERRYLDAVANSSK